MSQWTTLPEINTGNHTIFIVLILLGSTNKYQLKGSSPEIKERVHKNKHMYEQ